jgi:hypothetical protein
MTDIIEVLSDAVDPVPIAYRLYAHIRNISNTFTCSLWDGRLERIYYPLCADRTVVTVYGHYSRMCDFDEYILPSMVVKVNANDSYDLLVGPRYKCHVDTYVNIGWDQLTDIIVRSLYCHNTIPYPSEMEKVLRDVLNYTPKVFEYPPDRKIPEKKSTAYIFDE